MDLNQVTLPASDMDAAVAFYRKLGFIQIVDTPHYARFECPEGNSTVSVHRVDRVPEPSGVVVYFETTRLDELVAELQSMGIEFTQEPRDQRWLWREARLHDPAGNTLCLYSAGRHRKHPPWRIEP